jgi:hypothetical protein
VTPASLIVRGLFPSQLLNGQLEQTAFTDEKQHACDLLLQRLAGFEAQFNGTALSGECLAWREKLEVWECHKFTAELDAMLRLYSWDKAVRGWLNGT